MGKSGCIVKQITTEQAFAWSPITCAQGNSKASYESIQLVELIWFLSWWPQPTACVIKKKKKSTNFKNKISGHAFRHKTRNKSKNTPNTK